MQGGRLYLVMWLMSNVTRSYGIYIYLSLSMVDGVGRQTHMNGRNHLVIFAVWNKIVCPKLGMVDF